ncbi:MAG: Hpt domain-containing protein [Spirochaetia bacterium]
MIDKFKDTFKEEAYELLNKLEDCLLVVEENPDNRDEVSALFRTMHTIKGSAAMFGFQHISDFTHEVESILELVREGKIKIGPELIDLTLKARDHIRNMLDQEDLEGEFELDYQDLSTVEGMMAYAGSETVNGQRIPALQVMKYDSSKNAYVKIRDSRPEAYNEETGELHVPVYLQLQTNYGSSRPAIKGADVRELLSLARDGA